MKWIEQREQPEDRCLKKKKENEKSEGGCLSKNWKEK